MIRLLDANAARTALRLHVEEPLERGGDGPRGIAMMAPSLKSLTSVIARPRSDDPSVEIG